MHLNHEELIDEAKTLRLVPLVGTTLYQEKTPQMTKYVDDSLTSHLSINDLIGNNPLKSMYDNHKHHAAFMATVFSVGNYELLARTIPWVYRSYSAHNFSCDYFFLELKAWVEAIDKYISSDQISEIKSVYLWMIKRHENMQLLSKTEPDMPFPISEDWLERKNSFLAALLTGDHRKCLEISDKTLKTGKDIEAFYLQIIQPVMYEVGMLWERGTISVAQEHLASAIVGRVMATTCMLDVAPRQEKAKVVISAAPNEFHEIGAWMVSDILEHDGWDVRYLGANTPVEGLLEMLRSFQPNVLALSVTMPFNIINVRDMITAIKGDKELKEIRVIVGGRAFNETHELWQSTGADDFAANAQEIKAMLCVNE